jgi:hypothetical protein
VEQAEVAGSTFYPHSEKEMPRQVETTEFEESIWDSLFGEGDEEEEENEDEEGEEDKG